MGPDFHRGQALYELGRFSEAIESYRSELAGNPNSAISYAMIAASLFNLNRVKEAEEQLRQALALDPELACAFYLQSFIDLRRGRLDKAEKSIAESVRLVQLPNSFHQWATIAEARGKFDDALAATAQALRLDPTHNESIILRGRLLAKEGKLDEAHALYISALSNNPLDAAAQHALGSLQLRTGKSNAALGALREARRLDPVKANDAGAIALAYGRLIWPLRIVDRCVFRWCEISRKKQCAMFMLLAILLAAGGKVAGVGLEASAPGPWWAGLCVAIANYLALPFSFDRLARAVGYIALRHEMRLPWYRLLLRPLIIIPAVWIHFAATMLGVLISLPCLGVMAALLGACFPLLSASVQTSAVRLTSWVCLPLFFLIMIVGTLGAIMLDLESVVVGLPILVFSFGVAFTSDSIIRWTTSVGFRRNPHLLDLP